MTSATQHNAARAWPDVYLERIDASQHMARFYLIYVQPTLFGEWAVIYQWGRIGSRGQRREHWLASWTEACAACGQQRARKIRRGYSPRSSAFDRPHCPR